MSHETPTGDASGTPCCDRYSAEDEVAQPEHGDLGSSASRRRVLASAAAIGATAVAGCLGGEGTAPAAIAITAEAACDECGMVISKHPGPNGEIYWQDTDPDRHDAPFWFDSLKQCLFPHYFEGTDAGRELDAVYATDYATVDYDVQSQDGERYITSHTSEESLADATELHFVVESDVTGAMGPDFVPFGDRSDADAFAGEYGGSVVAFDDVTPALVGK